MNKSYRVVLDTKSGVEEFVKIANNIEEEVYLENGNDLKVNAKSLMGVLYGQFEFHSLYVVSTHDLLYEKFNKFII